ncbi:CENPU protein, partial [Rhinopomastus cyanomelas]|nr:CENPU protein [Rhinopomastus cyanomelas]
EEPDVSRILKVAESNQLEEAEDSFDHPLHSTAVDADGEEPSENEPLGRVSGPQRKSAERSEKRHHSGESGVAVQEPGADDSGDESLQESPVRDSFTVVTSKFDDHRLHAVAYLRSVVAAAGPCSVQLWCPTELKRTSRDVTELDVVLSEFEKVAANYRQSRESDICRKAVDGFCAAFKSQITDLIVEAQELEDMKRKNATIMRDIQKKRQQLFQLQAELIRAEPQLTELQREYAELQERKSSLRQATQLLTDLKELQADCVNYRKENPEEAAVYGTSSLPALLVESQRVLGAEKHFHNINLQLEKALAVRR